VDGDIITAVNGVPVKNEEELTVYLETKTVVGDTVELSVIRNGAEQQIAVTVAASPQ
jgi:S1-C subfamily serine protease